MTTTMTISREDHSTIAIEDYILFLFFLGLWSGSIVFIFNVGLIGFKTKGFGLGRAYLVSMLIALITFGLTYKRRIKLQAICGTIIGMAGYTVLLYRKVYAALSVIFALIATAVVIVCFVIYLVKGNRRNRSIIKYWWARIIASLYMSRIILAGVGIAACIILPVAFRLEQKGIHVSEVTNTLMEEILHIDLTADRSGESEDGENGYVVTEVYGDEYCLDNNFERIKPFANEGEWESLSLEQRQDSVTALLECEERYLGIPYTITLIFSDEMDYATKGYYSYKDHTVFINNEMLRKDGAEMAMNSTLHEARHIYQFAMCEVLVRITPEQRNLISFYDVNKWMNSALNYVSGEDDYWDYYTQSLEQDSRFYAHEHTVIYRKEINDRLREKAQIPVYPIEEDG